MHKSNISKHNAKYVASRILIKPIRELATLFLFYSYFKVKYIINKTVDYLLYNIHFNILI